MFIDLRKLARSGKTEENFFFEYTPETELVDIPDCKLCPPVKVSGKVILTGNHSAYIDGEACFTLIGNCTRCLKETERVFVAEISEEVSKDSEDSYPLKNDVVDLTKIVDDKIIMNVPVNFLCNEDCLGICPKCGQNLNDGKCKCE